MKLWKKDGRVYLDSAAAVAPTKRALQAFAQGVVAFGNPASVHQEGVAAKTLLEASRSLVASLAEVKPDAVVFTGSATEANALVIQGVPAARARAGMKYEDMHVLFDAGAHASLVHAVEALAEKGVRTEAISYAHGQIDTEGLQKQIRENTVLIAVSAVCGETGAITHTRDARRVIDKAHTQRSAQAVLHVDASQLPRVGAFELTRLGANTLALDAQKVGGVRGIGVLVAPHRINIAPLMQGGGQERGLRPGTPSPALAASFAEALIEAHEKREQFVETSRLLRTQLIEKLSSIERCVVNEGKENAPHMLNVSFVGRDTDYLVALLNEEGFAVSTKSACETDSTGSRAVLQLTGDESRAASTLRISWDCTVTESQIGRFADAVIRSVKFLDTAGIL